MLHVLPSKATLQLTYTVKEGCKYATRTRKITKKGTFCAFLIPPTTS